MNGIINVLKPPEMTSFDVVAALRGICKTKKIGHTGTLDPGAVGVLPICVGNATKAIEFMTEKDKVYRAELTLGVSTDTQDSSGKVIETVEVNVTEEKIIKAVKSFVGKGEQIPPMYSAIKVEGRKLYELAREGVEVERKPREIEIYFIDIIHIDLGKNKVLFDVACSKGTYIRTLCADIGERLECGGHMSFLLRLKAGHFTIDKALTFEEIAELATGNRLHEALTSVEGVFEGLQGIYLNEIDEKRFINGVFLEVGGLGLKAGAVVKILSSNQRFIALGEVISRGNVLMLKSKKMF